MQRASRPLSQWPLDHLKDKNGSQANQLLGKIQFKNSGCLEQCIEKDSEAQPRFKVNEFYDPLEMSAMDT